MKTFLAAALYPALLISAPITPTIILSNFQTSETLSVTLGYSQFSGFGFTEAIVNNNQIIMSLGSGGILHSNPTPQSLIATASVDFALDSYKVIGISLTGIAIDDGGSTGEAFGISKLGLESCTLAMSGSLSTRSGFCPIQAGLESGTISVWMRMYSDKQIYRSDTGEIIMPQIVLTVTPNPEPLTPILIGIGLIVIGMIKRSKNG